MARPASKSTRIALLGADSLLGRDLSDVLKHLDSAEVTTFSGTGEGTFGEEEGEAVFVQPLTADTLKGIDFVVLAGSAEGARKAYELSKASPRKPVLIDCLGDLESQPEARIVAPLLEDDTGAGSWLRIPAHAAAHALALTLSRLNRFSPLRQSVVNIFEPASERGRKGIDELHKQTTGLLSFKSLNKEVYDAQVAFNLLPRLGEDAPAKLSGIEQRIERHLATLLSRHSGPSLLMPSMRLVQAPVFHGYSISLWAEFDRNISAEEIGHALASAHIEVRGETEEVPDIVGAAGQSGLSVGDIRTDRNNGRAVWAWLVTDNLRMTADAAAAIIKQGRPTLP